ncbi:hypothetical protein BD626DRAFT_535999 [Schizophyllum amplum]|uniref:Uncharacterized protein n=1 Tax=Schizophyllum amplum TaxID=97359 RepID=A0A550CIT4_9AGAR|nr:hypothetical protein BD626DRAFT_535999 [Auriculariopsis ampla]
MSDTEKLTPRSLLDEEGNFTLQNKDIYDLLKYVQTGALLPTAELGYRERVQLSSDMARKLSSVIGPLLTSYATTRGHCETFKTITYPSIISLSDDVYDYALKASGASAAPSPYAQIFDCVTLLADTVSQAEKSILRADLNGLVDAQVRAIDVLQVKAQRVVADLRAFEGQTMSDQAVLKERSNAVNIKLTSEQGSMVEIRAKLKALRDELDATMRQYEQAKIAACTTPTYAWLFPIGLIVASAMAGVNGEKAATLASRIDKVRVLVTDSEGKVRDGERMVANLETIDADLDNVIALIEPAVTAIQRMMGVWDAVAIDLTRLKTMTNTDVRKVIKVIADVVEQKVIEKWAALVAAVDKYRKAATVSCVLEQRSLNDLATELFMYRSPGLFPNMPYPKNPCFDIPEPYQRPGILDFYY